MSEIDWKRPPMRINDAVLRVVHGGLWLYTPVSLIHHQPGMWELRKMSIAKQDQVAMVEYQLSEVNGDDIYRKLLVITRRGIEKILGTKGEVSCEIKMISGDLDDPLITCVALGSDSPSVAFTVRWLFNISGATLINEKLTIRVQKDLFIHRESHFPLA